MNKKVGCTVVHDERSVFCISDMIKEQGGRAAVSKSGHTFFKKKLREIGAEYGGEISGHHYFKDFLL